VSLLERVGSIAAGYEHVAKRVEPGPSISVAGAVLKWYDVAPPDDPVPDDVRALAELSLRDAARSCELTLAGELGFVILHRCGESFYFLLVSTWRNENELWETVWAKDGDGDSAFRPWQDEDTTHRPTFCVWELAAVCHERVAWTEYLRSLRDDEAKQTYLRSTYEGAA
jgi:hypothetical protein